MKGLLAFAFTAVSAAAAAAQDPPSVQPRPELVAAIRAGTVGERYDGYLGYPADLPQALRRQVATINIRRRALYTDLASRRGVAPQVVAIATGCVLLARLPVGHIYMLVDKRWRRRGAGEPPPVPEHCPSP